METSELIHILHDLVTANHILHHKQVCDGYGHISVRNPDNPKTFFLSHSLAPALVSSSEDLVEYEVSDASPTKQNTLKDYSERFIHSELLKRFPSINCVIHSHSEAVLPYGISGVPMLPAFHMAGFLGSHVPVFEIAKHHQRGDRRDMLVSNSHLGAALASEFSKTDSYTARIGAVGAALVSQLTKSQGGSEDDLPPDYTVVLMRGHGFTAVGTSIREAVFRAVYTQQNAGVQTTSLLIRNAHLNEQERGKRTEEKLGAIDAGLHYLSEQEVGGCKEMGEQTSERPWGLWVREVEAEKLYISKA